MAFLIRAFLLVATLLGTNAQDALTHCMNSMGQIMGLVADYRHTVTGDTGGNPEKWQMVGDTPLTPSDLPLAVNSFTGTYAQVLPDDRDSYNHIYGPQSFSMTSMRFKVKVTVPGVHTLFVRWTGGDLVGGGDSLYVVLYESQDVNDLGAANNVPGLPTLKPKLTSILEPTSDGSLRFAGCCYDPVTHACPCCEAVPGMLDASSSSGPAGCTTYWVSANQGGQMGLQCREGHGELSAVPTPRWYLFAGQEGGNTMDFDSEPWDATCEAEGLGTHDTGMDLPQWDLATGDYVLAFYPREDGTALDAWYFSTPTNTTPPNGLRMKLGDSTTADKGCAPASGGGGPSGRRVQQQPSTSVHPYCRLTVYSLPGAEETPNTDTSPDGGTLFGFLLLGCVLGVAGLSACVRYRVRSGKAALPAWPKELSMAARARTSTLQTQIVGASMTTDSSSSAYVAPLPGLGLGAASPSAMPSV